MSYIFDVSGEHNDLWEVDSFMRFEGHGDYHGYNRRDSDGHLIYNVEFFDKRYALQFKLKFNATIVQWDESDNKEYVTVEQLLERGYELMELTVEGSRSWEFQKWCEERDYAIVDEMKMFNDREPFKVYVPAGHQSLVKLTWG